MKKGTDLEKDLEEQIANAQKGTDLEKDLEEQIEVAMPKKRGKAYEQLRVHAESRELNDDNLVKSILFRKANIVKSVQIGDIVANNLNAATQSTELDKFTHIYVPTGSSSDFDVVKITYVDSNKVIISYE